MLSTIPAPSILLSINSPKPPPNPQHPRRHKTRQSTRIAHTRKNNQPPIPPPTRRQNLPGNWNPRQTPKTHNSIARRVPPPKLLGIAQLAHADGRQADIAATRKTKENAKDAEARDATAGGEPDGKDADEVEKDGEDHGVEAAESVGDVAGNPAAEEGAGVDDSKKLVGEGGEDAVGEGVGGDVGKGDKETPFDKENAACRERKDCVSEDEEVGPDVAAYFWGQARADEEVGDEEEEEEYQGHDADGPFVTEKGEELLEHEGEYYTTDGTAGCSETSCGGAGGKEEVGDRGDGRREDEGGSDAAQDGEGEDEVPVFWEGRGVSSVP